MPASEAQINANRLNALRSTGPKTAEGKARSRCNALKHGLTGEGVALPNEDAAEVERRFVAMNAEMGPSGELGRALVRRIATLTVRLDRSVAQETAALSERVRRAEADFQAPEGLDAGLVDRLRAEAGARAMFDPSKEAILARRYEAASERELFRALKEFRQIEREAKAEGPAMDSEAFREELGSFLQIEEMAKEFEERYPETARPTPSKPPRPVTTAWNPPVGGAFDVPITIGRAR